MSHTTTTPPLTVVLVHGAFADSSSRAGVIERLQASGVQALAAANPLRGFSTLTTVSVGADACPHPQNADQ